PPEPLAPPPAGAETARMGALALLPLFRPETRMKRFIAALGVLCLAACTTPGTGRDPAAAQGLKSGIDPANMDPSANPRDDLYRYVNGGWLDRTEIPADRARWGAFDQLAEESLAALRAIIEEAASTEAPAGSEQRKIGDLYRSFMDEAALESLGIRPLAEELAEIDALSDKKQIPGLIARLAQTGVSTPFVPFVHQDNKDSTKYVVDLYQYGL